MRNTDHIYPEREGEPDAAAPAPGAASSRPFGHCEFQWQVHVAAADRDSANARESEYARVARGTRTVTDRQW